MGCRALVDFIVEIVLEAADWGVAVPFIGDGADLVRHGSLPCIVLVVNRLIANNDGILVLVGIISTYLGLVHFLVST